jgi:DNA processing protein
MAQVTQRELAWLNLLHSPGFQSRSVHALLAEFDSVSAAIDTAPGRAIELLGKSGVDAWVATGPHAAAVATDLSWLEKPQNFLICRDSSNYPRALAQISDPPVVLYGVGDPAWLDRPSLAIVGSRNATPQGLENAYQFAKALAAAGLTIVSGLAAGIDAAAHAGALTELGSTIAVLGTGADRVYPARHRDLAHEIAEAGALVSEFNLGTPPLGRNFPRRNRIISGMSLGCLVVEAALESGSLTTARHALRQNREVFAIPGSIHSPQAKGCHALIREGALLVDQARDILEELQLPVSRSESLALVDDSPLLVHLGFDPCNIDLLCQRSGWSAEQVLAALSELELAGHVVALSGGRFQRRC